MWLKETYKILPSILLDPRLSQSILKITKKNSQENMMPFFDWSSMIMVNRTVQTFYMLPWHNCGD